MRRPARRSAPKSTRPIAVAYCGAAMASVKPPIVVGRADANGQSKNLFGDRFDAGKLRAAAREHDLAEHQIARHVFDDLLLCHAQHFEHARNDDLAQLRGRMLARRATVERSYVEAALRFPRARRAAS